jgi:hypothetical protein
MELEVEGQEGNSCAQLDTLERMVYEVAFSGDAEQLYHVLRVGDSCWHFSTQQSQVLGAPSSLFVLDVCVQCHRWRPSSVGISALLTVSHVPLLPS